MKTSSVVWLVGLTFQLVGCVTGQDVVGFDTVVDGRSQTQEELDVQQCLPLEKQAEVNK